MSSVMEALQMKIALRLLEHADIPVCLVGEIALNYYNVPRVFHDIEICVPKSMIEKATLILLETGLFESEAIDEYDLYNEYKRDCPRVRATSWVSSPCAIVLLPDTAYGLAPLDQNVVLTRIPPKEPTYSRQITDIIPAATLHQVPMPRLAPFLAGLCQRFLVYHDDVAMIAAEQLVDGMDLDKSWCATHLKTIACAEVLHLVINLVLGKGSRIDGFSEKTVTCFIADEDEAARVKQIPGYE